MSQVDHEELLDAYEEYIQATDLAESAVQRYTTNVEQYLEWGRDLADGNPALDGVFEINPATIERHLREMGQNGYAPQSVKLRRASVKSFYDACEKLVKDQSVMVLATLDSEAREAVRQNPIEEVDTARIDSCPWCSGTSHREGHHTRCLSHTCPRALTDVTR